MSEESVEVTETVTETETSETLPDDHPLVRTLAAQKATIRELQKKARRLDDMEDAQKSEAEKAADRIAKAEAEVASVPAKVADALRAHLTELHQIDADDAELFLTATDPDTLLKQVTRLISQDKRSKKPLHVPKAGASPQPSDSEEGAFVRDLFAG